MSETKSRHARCKHSKGLKLKLVSWAEKTNIPIKGWVHNQGFTYKLCCSSCGEICK